MHFAKFRYSSFSIIHIDFCSMKRQQSNERLSSSNEDTVIGYITSHTPPKKGKNHFFFDVQVSPTKIQKSVWFDISKSAQIQEYCETGSPVKLQSVKFQNKGHSKYLSDLKLNSRSHATVADNSEIQFERNKLLAQDAVETTIKEVCQFADGDIVTIDASHSEVQ